MSFFAKIYVFIFLSSPVCAHHPLWSPIKGYVKEETHLPWKIKATQYTLTEEKN